MIRSLLLPRRRGFTLIEVLAVVLIITILAVIATPTVTYRLRQRRVEQAAQDIALMYRSAYLRSAGRGSAILVRFDNGTMTAREAVRGGATADCAELPVSSCTLPDWNAAATGAANDPAGYRVLRTYSSELENGNAAHVIKAFGPPASSGEQAVMDICFTPIGNAYVRYGTTANFVPLVGVPRVEVFRDDGGGNAVGLTRQVMVLPNGATRLGVAK